MQAFTKFPNTPESDREPMVWHVVLLDDGTRLELLATDPQDAIARVQAELTPPSASPGPADGPDDA